MHRTRGFILAVFATVWAAAIPLAHADVTCKDGSTSHGGKGACSHHGGVASDGASNAAPAPAQPSHESRSSTPAPPPSTQGRAAPAPAPRPSTSPTPQAPPQPGQPTAKCKDGSMSYSTHHSGACSHHGGVAQWLQAN